MECPLNWVFLRNFDDNVIIHAKWDRYRLMCLLLVYLFMFRCSSLFYIMVTIFLHAGHSHRLHNVHFSSAAKIRSEVLSPFRSVRMFFYLAFVASGAIGGLIATTQLIAALSNPAKAGDVPEIAKGLIIDIGAVSVFAFLYSRESAAKNAQLARLSREESLSNLKLRIDERRIIPVSSLRGAARLVICAGPASFIAEAFKFSEPYTEGLLERAVLVVPFATDGNTPSFEFDETEEMKNLTSKRKRLWQLAPVYASEWSR